MATTYTINASNQTVTGTAAGEIFEFDSTLTNSTFTNVVINAAGGTDTIKAGTPSITRQTIDAAITGLNPSSLLDFGETYGDNFFYFSTQPDGIHITNESGSFKLKLLGVTDTSICTRETVNMFMALQQTTKWDDYLMGGTALADTLTINHARCKATGRGGDDTTTDYLFGGAGMDVFQVGKTDGNDAVFGAANNDVVYLYDVTVSDIISYAYDANTIALGTNSGNVISVVNGDAISPTFVLADGSAYRFNRAAYAWQGA